MRSRPTLAYPPSASTVAGHPRPRWQTVRATLSVADDTAAAPIVTFEEPDPAPVSPAGRTQRSEKPRRRPVGRLAVALALLCCALALLLAVLLGTPEHVITTQTAGQPTGQSAGLRLAQGATRHLSRLGPIRLPDPIGTVPRTVPLDTIWLVDADLPAADLTELSREAPVDVAYLAEHALPQDKLGFALNKGAQRAVLTDQAKLEEMAARPAVLIVARPGAPVRLPPVPHGHNRDIVVITADPAAWLNILPAGPAPPAPTAGSPPGRTWIDVLGLSPGSGSPADPLTPSRIQPQQLTADPGIRGSIARALARAFVAAIGAEWPG